MRVDNDDELKSFFICGVKINVLEIPEVVQAMMSWITEGFFGNYITIANANDVVLGKKSSSVRNAINQSSLSVADGMSLVLLARFKGYRLKKRVYGPDLMLAALKVSEENGYSSFLYGATDETLGSLSRNLKTRFPKLRISGYYAPPFRRLSPQEDEAVVKIINDSGADIVWVGLGCPKQQIWMYEHKNKLRASVMVGVGAAFDFFAGTKLQAPRWVREHGFEWLFRLVTEPKRLWRRYLISYPLFICYLIVDLIKNRSNSCKT